MDFMFDEIEERKMYLKTLKRFGFSTAPLFTFAAHSESEVNDILIKTYGLRAFLVGKTLQNEEGLFFCTNELPEGCQLFTFALKKAQDSDLFALKVPCALVNYWYFDADYLKRLILRKLGKVAI